MFMRRDAPWGADWGHVKDLMKGGDELIDITMDQLIADLCTVRWKNPGVGACFIEGAFVRNGRLDIRVRSPDGGKYGITLTPTDDEEECPDVEAKGDDE